MKDTFSYDEFRRGAAGIKGARGDLMLMGRTLAALDLLGRTGVGEVEIVHEESPVRWWVGGNWGGTRAFSEKFPYPAHAAEDLLARVVNGGRCGRCGQTTVVGIAADDVCWFMLATKDLDHPGTYRYLRSCELDEAAAGGG